MSSGYAKSPFDHYVEEQWVTIQLIGMELETGFYPAHWHTVWDPACGFGNVLKAFGQLDRIPLHATDIQFRGYAAKGLFQELDFVGNLDFVRSAAPKGRYSIVSNTPYSYKKGILEAFIRCAMALDAEKVAFLMPVARQAGENRQPLFDEFPPARIYVLSERPSMPPGAQIEALGDKAYKRGKIDFMWVVWDRRNPTPVGETRWRTIPVRPKAAKAVRT
jgi:hypothetical protein